MNHRLDTRLFHDLLRQAKGDSRQRSHYNLHPELSDPVQRLCIGLEPGTYLRPHKHPEIHRWELILAISGTVVMLLFDDAGMVTERLELADQGDLRGVELSPDTWHALFPIGEPAVILEVKQGPYVPTPPENFAPWSPAEDSPEARSFVAWSRTAGVGDHFPTMR